MSRAASQAGDSPLFAAPGTPATHVTDVTDVTDVTARGRALPVWRSLLYVPVTSERFVRSAATRGADAVILDLEDSIPPQDKALARERLLPALTALADCGSDRIVRVNSAWRLLVKDLEAAVVTGVDAIVLPKIRNGDHVRMIADVIAELERERQLPEGGIALVPLIETADALLHVDSIAQADPRVVAISLGDEDFCLSAGMQANEETLRYPKQLVSLAAHRAGILALGFLGTLANHGDLSGFHALLMRSKAFGYSGAPCIHPSQVAVLNDAFRPTEAEIHDAQRLLAGYHAALDAGRGAVSIDGRMVDKPVAERAMALLAVAQRIETRERIVGTAKRE
jgi:citrate lyase subunit beta/citryl-CoA lyase